MVIQLQSSCPPSWWWGCLWSHCHRAKYFRSEMNRRGLDKSPVDVTYTELSLAELRRGRLTFPHVRDVSTLPCRVCRMIERSFRFRVPWRHTPRDLKSPHPWDLWLPSLWRNGWCTSLTTLQGPGGVASYPPVCFSRVGRSQTMARLSADSLKEHAGWVVSDSDEIDWAASSHFPPVFFSWIWPHEVNSRARRPPGVFFVKKSVLTFMISEPSPSRQNSKLFRVIFANTSRRRPKCLAKQFQT